MAKFGFLEFLAMRLENLGNLAHRFVKFFKLSINGVFFLLIGRADLAILLHIMAFDLAVYQLAYLIAMPLHFLDASAQAIAFVFGFSSRLNKRLIE